MNIPFKDYYKILSLSPEALESDVKNAYRKLARKHHPDLFSVGMKKVAEERFKEINEAYTVLQDSRKRTLYDQLYNAWQEKSRPGRAGAWPRRHKEEKTKSEQRRPVWGQPKEKAYEKPKNEEHERTFSDFFQSLFTAGDEKYKTEEKRYGSTREKPKQGSDLEEEVTLTLEEVATGTTRHITVQRESRCLFCQGRGFTGRQTCARCQGAGVILEDKQISVKIPMGIGEGDRIRLAGQGKPGTGGGHAGNRYITVRFSVHPQFNRTEDHLEMNLSLLPWEAALGTERQIKTLAGEVLLKIPAGTQNGQRFRLRGKGLPTRKDVKQDLYVRIEIKIPASMTPEEKEHYVELARLAKKT